MKIKLFRIHSDIEDLEREQYSNQYIDDINIALASDDIELTSETDSPINLVFVESGGSEAKFVELLPSLTEPILILQSSKYNSLPATLEINTYCHLNNIQAIMILGSKDECVSFLKNVSNFLMTREEIKGSRLGVIGKPSDWLIASKVDYKEVKEKFFIDIVDIPYEEFIDEINKEILPDIKIYDELLEKVHNDVDRLNSALHIYSALKRLIDLYNLDGLTVRCFDLLSSHKTTSCLALALLNQENIVATCEGDVPTMITMYIMQKVSGFSSFQANPSSLEFDKKEILFSHCTLPLNMCRSYTLDTHFESKLGIGIKGELDTVRASVVKLCPDLKTVLAVSGNINKNESYEGYCRSQISMSFDPRSVMAFATIPFGNHVVISYGDYYRDFLQYIELSLSLYETKKDKE